MSDQDTIFEAIVGVESSGRGYTPSGLLRTRLEIHHLRGGEPPLKFPFLYASGERSWHGKEHLMQVDPRPGELTVGVHTDDSTEQAALRYAIAAYGGNDACYAISMGEGQIMGFNYARVGYDSPWAMYLALAASAEAQRDAMRAFIESDRRLLSAIEDHNWFQFARYYNGDGQMEKYGNLIRDRLQAELKGPEFAG